jgi:hypothetical protein
MNSTELPGPPVAGLGPAAGTPQPAGAGLTSYSLEEGLPPFVSLLPRAGKVGTLIGVLGQGFTGATNVSFNGASASFTVNTSGSPSRFYSNFSAALGPSWWLFLRLS